MITDLPFPPAFITFILITGWLRLQSFVALLHVLVVIVGYLRFLILLYFYRITTAALRSPLVDSFCDPFCNHVAHTSPTCLLLRSVPTTASTLFPTFILFTPPHTHPLTVILIVRCYGSIGLHFSYTLLLPFLLFQRTFTLVVRFVTTLHLLLHTLLIYPTYYPTICSLR